MTHRLSFMVASSVIEREHRMQTIKKKRLLYLLIAELTIFVIVVVCGILQRRSMAEVPLDLSEFAASDAFEYTDGMWAISEEQLASDGLYIESGTQDYSDNDVEEESPIYLQSRKIKLPKGDYTLAIEHDNSVNQDVELLCGKNYWRLLKSEVFHLSKNQSATMYHLCALDDIPDFQIQVQYNKYGVFRISKMSLVPNSNGLKRSILAVFLLSLLIDYLYLHITWIRNHRTRLMVLGAVAFMLSAPLFSYGIAGGHDIMFHMMRIEGIAEGIRNHQFPVRMDPVWLDNYGYPVSVYYGDALLYIPAVFRLFGYSVITSYKMFMVLVNVATVWIAYRCFRGIFKDYKIAVVTTVAYSIAPYRFSCLYQRQALGEYCAMMFFPLIALAIYRIYTSANDKKHSDYYNVLLLSSGMLGLLVSHILSTEITVVILVLIALLFIKKTITWTVLRELLQSVVMTGLMGCFFIVPFLDYYMNVAAKVNSDVSDGGFALIQ